MAAHHLQQHLLRLLVLSAVIPCSLSFTTVAGRPVSSSITSTGRGVGQNTLTQAVVQSPTRLTTAIAATTDTSSGTAAARDGSNDDDTDATSTSTGSTGSSIASTEAIPATIEPPGLGGKRGLSPDINSLKRNLVQEAVKAYKSELLELLGSPNSASSIGAEPFRSSSWDESDNAVVKAAAAAASAANGAEVDSAPASALHGSGSGRAAATEFDEVRDGNRPVSYYKYGPGAALTGRTYAGEWATRDELIEDKLAALVQANPVSTTTDSNLLEGQWEFVFSSTRASDIVDPSRFVLIRAEKGAKGNSRRIDAAKDTSIGPEESRPWAGQSGRSENPLRYFTRNINLEDLKDDEEPYVIDTTQYLGGMWSVRRKYDVTGLSRTALDLGLCEKEMRALGLSIPLKKQKKRDEVGSSYLGRAKVQVLYLDTDLCVTTTEDGLDGPLLVYTKRSFWTVKRKSRFLLATASWLWSKQSPFRIRQRLGVWNTKHRASPDGLIAGPPEYDDEENRVMLQRTYADKSRLQVLKMGEPLINPDGTLREDLTDSWDGDSDPFVHLDPMERQEILKGMTIEEIEAAGKAQRVANKRGDKRFARPASIDRSFKKMVKDEANEKRQFKTPRKG